MKGGTGEVCRPRNARNPPVAEVSRIHGGDQPALALVQVRQQRRVLLLEDRVYGHACSLGSRCKLVSLFFDKPLPV